MSLLNLSDDILLSMCIHFLSSENICRLDSALCSQKHRIYFLNLISSKDIILKRTSHGVFLNNTKNKHLSCWKWLKMRNIGLDSLDIDTKTFTTELLTRASLLLNVFRRINNLSISYDEEVEEFDVDCFYLSFPNRLKHLSFCDESSKIENVDEFCKSFLPSKEFNKLSYLAVYYNQISDIFLNKVSLCCEHLHEVFIADCRKITDAGLIAVFKSNPHIQIIYLDGCPLITTVSIDFVANNCVYLKTMTCDVKKDMPLWEFILNCPALTDLNLNAYSSTQQSVSSRSVNNVLLIEKNLNLVCLNIWGINANLSRYFASVLVKCKYLTSLSLTYSVFCDACMISLANNCHALQSLTLWKCQLIGSSVELFRNILEQCTMVTYLGVSDSDGVNETYIVPIVAVCGKLLRLELRGAQLSDITLDAIALHCIAADNLSVHRNPAITSDGIKRMIANKKGCPLRYISVTKVAFPDLETLRAECAVLGTTLLAHWHVN